MTDIARWQARVAHAAAGGIVGCQHASLASGLIGLASAPLLGPTALSAIGLALLFVHAALLAGGLWLGFRLRFDALLFRALADTDDLDGFDRAMLDLGLLGEGKAGRPMAVRVAGLLRLVRLMMLVVAAQLVLLAAGFLAWR